MRRQCDRSGRVALLAALLGAACHGPRPGLGPLPVRNQHPAQLTVQHLDPVAASTLPGGTVQARVTLAYTSLFLAGNGPGAEFAMDGEVLRSRLMARAGLGAGFELAAELPVLHTSGGFLDSFLIDYHELFGFPDQDRSDTPKDRFDVFAAQSGNRVFQLDEEPLLLADVPLSLTWGLVPPGRTGSNAGTPGLALRLGVELPTGDEDHGAGNGEVDWAAGLAASWPLDLGTVHAAVQHTWAGTPDRARQNGFEFRDVTSASGTFELPLLEDLSGLVQFEWETSTLRDLRIPVAADDQLLLWVGGRLRIDRDLYFELSFGEDLASYVSPDFTAWFSVAWLPGPPSWRGRRL
ncbi:MAG: DUF3187 family protein [Planctomycetota bacterium]